MTICKRALLAAVLCCASHAWSQSAEKSPHLGYLYPAGGQQGSTFRILAGGQFVQGVTDVLVSGEGVHATVIKHYRPLKNLDADQRKELMRRFSALWEQRWTEYSGPGSAPPLPALGIPGKGGGKLKEVADRVKFAATGVELPEHPLLDNLDSLSIRGLASVIKEVLEIKKRQQNAQLGESVLIEITIDPTAQPGDRELRMKAPTGLTNPMCFQVGQLPEVCEQEPNDPHLPIQFPEEPSLKLPVTLDGQIKPGDVDRFQFHAQSGQNLVLRAQARHLDPYLADAVPGWFQATMSLYDAQGNEVAFDDDYGFDPDPALFYTVPADGDYVLEIRDSIYRGREDFVYRVSVSEDPFVTSIFPLGGQLGEKVVASVFGWNIDKDRLRLDTEPGGGAIRQAFLKQGDVVSNPILYAVDALPECAEHESNDTEKDAQRVKLPCIVNGRIGEPGDEDVFSFKAKAGETVVAEVYARRLRSELDATLKLTDETGKVVASNDDHEDKESGLLTQYADPYLCVQLTSDGAYFVHLTDTQRQGGESCGYRLRIGPPHPDFALRVAPSSVNVAPGRAAVITVYAFRKEGFDGDIEVALSRPPDGFRLDGGRIPASRDRVRMTLSASADAPDEPVAVQFEGSASIGGERVSHLAVPAEDLMQAFAYRHLAPSQELLAAVKSGGGKRMGGMRKGARAIEIADALPLRLPLDGTTTLNVRAPKGPMLQQVQLELSDPPKGISLSNVNVTPTGLAFDLKAEGDALKPGYADNLIVEGFIEIEKAKPNGKSAPQKQRTPVGALPAIPFEIVPR